VPQQTIDRKAFRINLVVLASVIVAAGSGAMFFGTLRTDIDRLTEATIDLKSATVSLKGAIDRNTSQITIDGRTVSALQATVTMVQQRLDQIERIVEKR